MVLAIKLPEKSFISEDNFGGKFNLQWSINRDDDLYVSMNNCIIDYNIRMIEYSTE